MNFLRLWALARRPAGRHAESVFVADDLGAWLVEVLADGGRRKLTELVLGTDQERALRSAATVAVRLTAAELVSDDDVRAEQLAMVISEVFGEPLPGARMTGHNTLLEELQAGIAEQLTVLDDASLTGTGASSAEVLGIPAAALVERLTGQLVREILVRGSRGGPLFPLASQINDDVTHLQGQRLEAVVGQIAGDLRRLVARVDAIPAVAAAPLALAELPPPTAGFTGRNNELAVLAELLGPTQTTRPVVVSAVAGLAGAGKTALAVGAGHAARQRGWFAGGTLFVDMHGYDETPVQPGQALDALLRALGVPAPHIPPGVEARAGLYRSVLGQTREPILIVIDNVSSEAQVRPLLPGTGPHKMLITSRHTLAGLDARLVDIAVLEDVASIELLDSALRAARTSDDRISRELDETGQLVRMCGGLPLALQVVAALLKADPVLSVGELAGELRAEDERLGRLRYDDGSPGRMSVPATFTLSYQKLDEATARMFRLLPIDPGPSVSTAAAAVLADLPVGEARQLLSGLVRAHLAEGPPGAGNRWRMHDLVHLYAQQLSDDHADTDGQERARDRLFGYYLQTALAADRHIRALPGMSVPGSFTDRDMALAWLDAERAGLVAIVSMAARTGRDKIALELPSALMEYFGWRRRFDDALATAAISLQAARRLGDKHAEGTALNHYGLAMANLRRFDDAIAACRDASAILNETGDQRSEGMAQFNLGMAFSGTRRFDDAITAFQRDLQICFEAGDRRGMAKTLDVLGDTLRQVRAFDDALIAHQDAADIFREAGDRHGEGTARLNIAAVLTEVRRLDEAILAFGEAAALLRETGDQHSLGTISMNVGLVLSRLRRFDEAIAACEEAVATFRKTGDRHDEGKALLNLSIALRGAGRSREAIAHCEDAVVMFRETADRHAEGIALDDLGASFVETGRLQEAITAHREAAAIFRETGDRHGEGVALSYLGVALLQSRRFDEAITTCQSSLTAFRETGERLGEGSALNNLGVALGKTGRLQEATAASQGAIAILWDIGDRRGVAIARHNIGSAMRQDGNLEEAVAAFRDAAVFFREAGDRHGEGTALTDLARALRQASRGEEAIVACEGAALAYREVGDRHGEGLALNDCGSILLQLERFDEAIRPYQSAAAALRETGDRRGEGAALNDLGTALREIGRVQEAIRAYQEAAAIFLEIGHQQYAASAQYNLGLVLRQVGRDEEAVDAFCGAEAGFREAGQQDFVGMTLMNLGALLSKRQCHDEAITAERDAVSILIESGNRRGEAAALDDLGRVLREAGRFEEAITAFQDAASTYREIGDQDGERTALNDIKAVRDAVRH